MIDFHEIVDRMNKNQRINYDKVFQRMARDWQKTGRKPHILLHSCCGPCSTAVLDRLADLAEVTVYYYNPNIHPEEEYRRREYVQKEFIREYNEKTGHDIHFQAAPYDPENYFAAVKGLEDEKEGGKRCSVCFFQRMKAAGEKMKELGCDYFTTTLTVSPHKNSQVINTIGEEIEDTYQLSYLPTDFKKGNGYLKSTQLAAAYHLYRQSYCGCVFGAHDQGLDLEQVRQEAAAFLKEHRE